MIIYIFVHQNYLKLAFKPGFLVHNIHLDKKQCSILCTRRDTEQSKSLILQSFDDF